MVACAIKGCKNWSGRSSKQKDGVTFHRFPKTGIKRELWKQATGKPAWEPAKSSVVCSEHFESNCFTSQTGRRYLVDGAYPTLRLSEETDSKDFQKFLHVIEEMETANNSVMEEKDLIRREDLCRICLKTKNLKTIYSKFQKNNYSEMIMDISGVTIDANDALPQQICTNCSKQVRNFYKFKKKIKANDRKLRLSLGKVKIESRQQESEEDMKLEVVDNDIDTGNNGDRDNINDGDKDVGNDAMVKEEGVDDAVSKWKHKKQQCFSCGKIMSSKYRLTMHMRIHTGEKPHTCEICKKKFSLLQNYKIHLRTHTGLKPYECTVCGRAFAHFAGLAAHGRMHTGVTPYKCALCPMSFKTPGHLSYHIKKHTGEKKFECATCKKSFITSSYLKQHQVIHSKIKEHICCICGTQLSRASHLKRHLLTHEERKEYACNICNCKYLNSKAYTAHMETKH